MANRPPPNRIEQLVDRALELLQTAGTAIVQPSPSYGVPDEAGLWWDISFNDEKGGRSCTIAYLQRPGLTESEEARIIEYLLRDKIETTSRR